MNILFSIIFKAYFPYFYKLIYCNIALWQEYNLPPCFYGR